ncbi:hypothetical protein KFZ58_14820 [Virgibacillus sp. NKC19-16]|uniref:esterase/lipase family protein n=1 Tax=Virgibacillus salidurans TaxID=2831673 RepID=UPI001F428638|nr:hypothetical protein [Virgibacillus sp. NKC19-16]UJL45652.1 hypothetical protein KFZ58_14820 [Virgibacillus sp. NKC19-16]
MKKSLGLFIAIFFAILVVGYAVPVAAEEAKELFPDDPISVMGKGSNGNEETPGEWYAGETPPDLQDDAPILLFVPGLNNVAQVFWEDNDMYQTAYDAGYQTAFVQLHDAGGASADMWNNGELLADKIEEISSHFEGKKITIIGYSKGGIDAQTALTYYGASEYVDNVITLSSPHHGSQLADLANSSWAGWLADLIGMRGEGTTAMETGYMENFRVMMDQEPLAYANDYFTLGGTDWGSMFSSTWFGGTYLSSYGDNDGVVTTASSNLPGGHELAIGDWNHTSIRTGLTFPVFEDYIAGDYALEEKHIFGEKESAQNNTPATNQWVHGGSLSEENDNNINVAVEENVAKVTLHVLTADELSEINVIDPSGKEVNTNAEKVRQDEGFFPGAISHSLTLDKPQAGEWQVEMATEKDNAYLLVANYDTEMKLDLGEKTEKEIASLQKDQQLTYNLNVNNSKEVLEDTVKATYHVTESGNPKNSETWFVAGDANLSQELTFDKQNQAYNITIDIEGSTKDGNVLKRTIIDSVYVGEMMRK